MSHINEALLVALEQGYVSPGQFLKVMVSHLESCTTCGEGLAKWRERGVMHADPLRSAALLSILRTPTSTKDPAELARATAELEELLELATPSKQLKKIQRSIKRFRSPLLAQLLLQESEEERNANPQLAQHYAELALQVLWYSPASIEADETRCCALAHMAAARKGQGNLFEAGKYFAEARAYLSQIPDPGLETCAELDWLEGGYCKDRRQLIQSQKLLERAVIYFDLLDRKEKAARARIVLSLTLYNLGEEDTAVDVVNRALQDIDPVYDQRLYMMGRYNLALYLTESGRVQEAARCFKADTDLYQQVVGAWPNLALFFHWLAGKIHHGLDKLQMAETHLLRARDGFVKQGSRWDAIQVCLDLCLVYMASNRPEEVLALSEVMVTSYAADGLHQEALAAVKLFAEAAKAYNTNQRLVKDVAQFLEFSRLDPSLKCDVAIP